MIGRSSPGIIDSLTAGFTLVFRRPYLILVPFLVDVLLLTGPGISARPLIESAAAWLISTIARGPLTPDQLLEANALASQVTESVAGWNLVGVLGWQLPTFLGLGAIDPARPHMVVDSYAALLPLLLALALAGVLIACLFLAPLGQVVRRKTWHLPSLTAGLAGLWLRLVGYLGLVILLSLALGAIALLVIGLVMAVSPPMAAVVMLLAVGGGILVALYLFLGDEAVVVGSAPPLRAIKESIAIVVRHFWSVVGLFLLVNIISQGLGVIWGKIGTWQAGLWVALVGNAFIATGLVASVMVYYWGRRPASSEPVFSPIANTRLSMKERGG